MVAVVVALARLAQSLPRDKVAIRTTVIALAAAITALPSASSILGV